MTRRIHRSRPHRAVPFRTPALVSLLSIAVGACGASPDGSAAASAAAEASGADVVAFVGANVIPMDEERILANHTVIVRDGVIAEIGPAAQVSVPAGATQVDA
ncbi:MAG TPA: hypothetical protein VNZ57_14060, partial [Longimicrobiales bacterium]|nr:hypothetical protein [Longimicrobiales bacterium]